MNPLAVARGSGTVPDGVLVQEAAAGGGASYAALYDRYSDQVYNYCLRLTGSPHDAADATQDAFVNVLGRLQQDDRPVLDFASYLFAAARNESYSLMRKRSRTHPTDDVPDRAASQPNLETDPEPAVLLRDSQETVRRANAKLPPRYREVLALREVAGRSYGEIGQIMGISENAAAQLIFRARGKLKDALTAGAVASVVVATDDCEHARLLISSLEDGESITQEEQLWLDEHLEHCGSCRAARGVLLEVGASYRAWAVVPVIAALRPEVLTSAGKMIGADWSGVAASTPVGSGGANGSAAGANGSGANGSGAGGGADPSGSAAGTGGSGGGGTAGAGVPKPRGHHAVAQGALGAAVLAVTGVVAAGILHDGSPMTRDAAPAEVVRPAEESSEGAGASGSKADGSATAAKAAGIHGFQNSAAGAAPVVSNLTAGGPEKRSSRAPRDGPGSSPNRGGPKTGAPAPGDERPGSGPDGGGPDGGGPGSGPGGGNGGGGPGSGPGDGNGGGGPGSGPGGGQPGGGGGPGGGQPGPGGGPGSPGGTPGGGQTDPPGQPTDPGGGQPPDPPPAGGGDCSWPGHGGGPGGCPPGHGGVPPGHGGTPPGQGKKQR